MRFSSLLPSMIAVIMAQNTSTSEILPLLKNASLVPQIVPTFNATVGPFVITYRSAIVNYGNSISNAASTYAPNITFPAEAAFPNAKYTLAMVDPDAPTPQNPTSAQIRHWLVSNVSPSSSPQNLSMNGNVLSGYRSPTPPAGSDPHRYSFFLLRQPTGANISVFNQTGISMFNLATFIRQNQLTPVSGNFFNESQSSTTSTTGSSSSASTSSRASGSSSVTGSSTASSAAALWQFPLLMALMGVSVWAVVM